MLSPDPDVTDPTSGGYPGAISPHVDAAGGPPVRVLVLGFAPGNTGRSTLGAFDQAMASLTPDERRLLEETPVRFGRSSEPGADRSRPILARALGSDRYRVSVRFDPSMEVPAAIAPIVDRFRRAALSPDNVLRIDGERLAGKVLVLDNERMFHGRGPLDREAIRRERDRPARVLYRGWVVEPTP